MDFGSYVLGFGTAAGIAIAIPIVRAISDYRTKKEEQRGNFRTGTRCIDNDTLDLARAMFGTPCHYDFLDRTERENYLASFENQVKWWLTLEPKQLPRHLRSVLPERKRAARELIDVVSYLRKDNAKKK